MGRGSVVDGERGRKRAVRFDVLFQGGDLLLRSTDRIRAGDEATRRRRLTGDGDDRASQLYWIPSLLPIHGLPVGDQRIAPSCVVVDRSGGVARGFLRQQ